MEEQIESSWEKMLDRLANWIDTVIVNLPNLLIALIVFILAYWLGRNLQRWSARALKKAIRQPSIRNLISNIVAIIVIALGLFLALGILNLDTVLKSLLAGAGVAGLAIGLALQGTLANTFSGIFLAVKDIMNVGDWVETNGYEGTVMEIDLRHTQIKEADNNIVVIPNKMVLENPFKNYGLTKRIRATIKCGVSYDSDLRQVKQVAKETIEKLYPPEAGEEVEFYYLEFGDSSINFMVRFWVSATLNIIALEAKSRAILAIKEAFDEHDIDIPFPIQTLYHAEPGGPKKENTLITPKE